MGRTRVEPKTETGRRLRSARLRANFKSQRALAREVGEDNQTIYRVETKGHTLTQRLAELLAPVLNVSPAWLLFGSEEIQTTPEKERRYDDAIERYLKSEVAGHVDLEVVNRLMKIDYETLGASSPNISDVHAVREALDRIDRNHPRK